MIIGEWRDSIRHSSMCDCIADDTMQQLHCGLHPTVQCLLYLLHGHDNQPEVPILNILSLPGVWTTGTKLDCVSNCKNSTQPPKLCASHWQGKTCQSCCGHAIVESTAGIARSYRHFIHACELTNGVKA
eukprot:4874618-Amphidinium_carterae.1